MEIHHAHPRGELGWQSGRGDDATNDGLECLFECDSGWSGHRGGSSRSRHARRTMRVRGREEMGWVGPRWGGGVWRGWGAVRVDLPRCAHLTGLSIGIGIGIVGDMMAWMGCVLPPGPLLVPSSRRIPLHGGLESQRLLPPTSGARTPWWDTVGTTYHRHDRRPCRSPAITHHLINGAPSLTADTSVSSCLHAPPPLACVVPRAHSVVPCVA